MTKTNLYVIEYIRGTIYETTFCLFKTFFIKKYTPLFHKK